MTVVEKIDYLVHSLDISEHKFLRKYHIRKKSFKRWRDGSLLPSKSELNYLCDSFDLSIDDFLDNNSTISYLDKKENEHLCEKKSHDDIKNIVNEDYPFEDNARYEEKD